MEQQLRKNQRKKESVPSFLKKLFEIINNDEQNGIIQWAADGLSFEVLDRTSFTGQTLPTYFKHSNLNSFVRQLNMYDFHKCKRSTDEIEFRHPFFQRERPDLLNKIKRKTNSSYVQALNTYEKIKSSNHHHAKALLDQSDSASHQVNHNSIQYISERVSRQIDQSNNFYGQSAGVNGNKHINMYDSNYDAQFSHAGHDQAETIHNNHQHHNLNHNHTPPKSMGATAANIHENHQIKTLVKQQQELLGGLECSASESVMIGGRGALPNLESLKQPESQQKQQKGLLEQLQQRYVSKKSHGQRTGTDPQGAQQYLRCLLSAQFFKNEKVAAKETLVATEDNDDKNEEHMAAKFRNQNARGDEAGAEMLLGMDGIIDHGARANQQDQANNSNIQIQKNIACAQKSTIDQAMKQHLETSGSGDPSAFIENFRMNTTDTPMAMAEHYRMISQSDAAQKQQQQQNKEHQRGTNENSGPNGGEINHLDGQNNQRTAGQQQQQNVDDVGFEKSGQEQISALKDLKSVNQVELLRAISDFSLDGKQNMVLDNSSRLVILQAFTEKNLDNINNMLLDVQAQMIQMNQCWSETLARFFYELKQQQNKRNKLTTLLQVIVSEIVTYQPSGDDAQNQQQQNTVVNQSGSSSMMNQGAAVNGNGLSSQQQPQQQQQQSSSQQNSSGNLPNIQNLLKQQQQSQITTAVQAASVSGGQNNNSNGNKQAANHHQSQQLNQLLGNASNLISNLVSFDQGGSAGGPVIPSSSQTNHQNNQHVGGESAALASSVNNTLGRLTQQVQLTANNMPTSSQVEIGYQGSHQQQQQQVGPTTNIWQQSSQLKQHQTAQQHSAAGQQQHTSSYQQQQQQYNSLSSAVKVHQLQHPVETWPSASSNFNFSNQSYDQVIQQVTTTGTHHQAADTTNNQQNTTTTTTTTTHGGIAAVNNNNNININNVVGLRGGNQKNNDNAIAAVSLQPQTTTQQHKNNMMIQKTSGGGLLPEGGHQAEQFVGLGDALNNHPYNSRINFSNNNNNRLKSQSENHHQAQHQGQTSVNNQSSHHQPVQYDQKPLQGSSNTMIHHHHHASSMDNGNKGAGRVTSMPAGGGGSAAPAKSRFYEMDQQMDYSNSDPIQPPSSVGGSSVRRRSNSFFAPANLPIVSIKECGGVHNQIPLAQHNSSSMQPVFVPSNSVGGGPSHMGFSNFTTIDSLGQSMSSIIPQTGTQVCAISAAQQQVVLANNSASTATVQSQAQQQLQQQQMVVMPINSMNGSGNSNLQVAAAASAAAQQQQSQIGGGVNTNNHQLPPQITMTPAVTNPTTGGAGGAPGSKNGGNFGDIMYAQLNNQLAMHSNLLQQLTNQLKSHVTVNGDPVATAQQLQQQQQQISLAQQQTSAPGGGHQQLVGGVGGTAISVQQNLSVAAQQQNLTQQSQQLVGPQLQQSSQQNQSLQYNSNMQPQLQ